MAHDLEELKARVLQFDMLELPGQIKMMHMGTSYLVHDLLAAVNELTDDSRELLAQLSDDEGDWAPLKEAAEKLNLATGNTIKGLDSPTEEPG